MFEFRDTLSRNKAFDELNHNSIGCKAVGNKILEFQDSFSIFE